MRKEDRESRSAILHLRIWITKCWKDFERNSSLKKKKILSLLPEELEQTKSWICDEWTLDLGWPARAFCSGVSGAHQSPLLPFCWVCSCGHTGKVITLFDDLEELAIGGCLLTPTHWTACPCLMGIQVMMAPYLPDCPPFLTPQNLSYLPLFLHLTGQ